jgi:pyrimidine operon attenuation protein/uracil phosphoribosyltransferase
MPARVVLQQADIQRALRRVSHEILEANHGGSDLVLLGIPTRGVMLAERIGANLDALEPGSGQVGSLDVTLYRDDLDRHPTRTPSPTRLPAGGIDGKTVVLVDRGHRELPIRADFVGKNLPTALAERIYVRLAEFDGEDAVAIETEPGGRS